MRIPKRYANEFRWWFAWGRECGQQFARSEHAFNFADVMTLFGRWKPLVSENWCWHAYLCGWVKGTRAANEEEA